MEAGLSFKYRLLCLGVLVLFMYLFSSWRNSVCTENSGQCSLFGTWLHLHAQSISLFRTREGYLLSIHLCKHGCTAELIKLT